MAKLMSQIHFIAGALALALLLALSAPAPVAAQTGPTAATSEQQLLKELKGGVVRGDVSIPDKKAANLIHPAGRNWETFQTVTLRWISGVLILGIIVVLAAFYSWRGKIEISGGRSGRSVVRFKAFERFTHWLTAGSFVVLAITGLNIVFGRDLLLPWMGASAFSAWSEAAKYTHNFISFAFTTGVVLMFLIWIGQNFPTAADVKWLAMGGGLFGKTHHEAPSWKFNAGQKLLYWFVVLGGGLMIVTGYLLIFPFSGGLNVGSMELVDIFHGTVAMVFMSLIIIHIYLGTVGMEGAFEAMGSGTVDYNWAKAHHSLWLKEELERSPQGSSDRPLATPAE